VKIAFVLPWYGKDIRGGAEIAARGYLEHLARRGWDVEVLTTCIRDFHSDWSSNERPAGVEKVRGVPVRRFQVRQRDADVFARLNRRLIQGASLTPEEERHFMREMINCPGLVGFISNHQDEYQFFFTPYLFSTTYWGSRAAPERSWILPCLHDEEYARMSIIKDMMESVHGIMFKSRAEMGLARRLFNLQQVTCGVIGDGIDTDVSGNAAAFRDKYDLKSPFILYVGRKDIGKNTPLLVDYFARYKAVRDNALKLVLVGSGGISIPSQVNDDVTDLGYVSTEDKYGAYRAATIFCQPSVNEAFSLVIMESWLCSTPVIVNGHCEVTVDHVRSSNGGLYFNTYAEFAGCIDYLLENPKQATRMAKLGARYVYANFTWDKVIDRFIRLVLDQSSS
jgi:glycosyltransferase involved in cell wall biosynthesis